MRQYLRSRWVQVGTVMLILGSGPLWGIILLAEIGVWPDPDPNPIGPGLLFFFTFWPSVVCIGIGMAKVASARRRGRSGAP